LIFFAFIAIVFWISGLSGKKKWAPRPKPSPKDATAVTPTPESALEEAAS
jgi:hypothetical protein